jgi:hypothetical protein
VSLQGAYLSLHLPALMPAMLCSSLSSPSISSVSTLRLCGWDCSPNGLESPATDCEFYCSPRFDAEKFSVTVGSRYCSGRPVSSTGTNWVMTHLQCLHLHLYTVQYSIRRKERTTEGILNNSRAERSSNVRPRCSWPLFSNSSRVFLLSFVLYAYRWTIAAIRQ